MVQQPMVSHSNDPCWVVGVLHDWKKSNHVTQVPQATTRFMLPRLFCTTSKTTTSVGFLLPQPTLKIHDGIVSPWENHSSWYTGMKENDGQGHAVDDLPTSVAMEPQLTHLGLSTVIEPLSNYEAFVTTFNYETHSMVYYSSRTIKYDRSHCPDIMPTHSYMVVLWFTLLSLATSHSTFVTVIDYHSLLTRYSPLFHRDWPLLFLSQLPGGPCNHRLLQQHGIHAHVLRRAEYSWTRWGIARWMQRLDSNIAHF